MDFGDEDLFAVFDSESTKVQRSDQSEQAFRETDDSADVADGKAKRDVKFDVGPLTVSLGAPKRQLSDDAEPVKKIKTDERTLMTGMNDSEVEKNIELSDQFQEKVCTSLPINQIIIIVVFHGLNIKIAIYFLR